MASSERCTAWPPGARAVRWAALFSSPFFHSTVAVDRSVVEQHGLRYDTSFEESEDYDLWTRLLEVADGDNVRRALVLYRKHDAQASARRAELQLECRRRVALRQIEALAPTLAGGRAELAWRAGGALTLEDGTRAEAADALRELVAAFEARHGGSEARRAAAWALIRRADARDESAVLLRAAIALDPLPAARSREAHVRAPFGAGRADGRDAGPGSRDARTRPPDDRPPGADARTAPGCSTASRNGPTST